MLKNPCSYKKKVWETRPPSELEGMSELEGSDLEGLDCINKYVKC